ncbi:AAA family ATPase [Bradyrhizobium sp. 2TAF24]|uniref:bifunctional aminoglycoside phosphotransferase/ATP-binding protein n=1 Tax=Bradyrhizobium sp. 2TAF24 TaxID=3233011 RepID=UPI003F8E1D64
MRAATTETPVPDGLQDEVFAFLADASHHGGHGVRRIDTHAASVFLAANRAYKVKRAVRFPFLDYSTLALRKAACVQELEVNRRFAPQIYLRVVPITRATDGSLHIGGDGEAVEWAVEMQRFDSEATLDHLAAAGPLPPHLATQMADAIVASHRSAPPAADARWVAAIPALITANTDTFVAEAAFPADRISTLDHDSHAAFLQLRDLLERRMQAGLVRRCHGDLHLANIALIDDRPVLFDAIEFDPALATTDILYDLAFPLMDLLAAGQAQAANILFNRYLSLMPDAGIEGLTALPLFLSLRAAIRANVLLRRRPVACDDGAATSYFDLARRLIAPVPPSLVAVGGLSGTGKSRLARDLAAGIGPAPGAVLLRSDIIRKQLFGVDELARLPSAAYQPAVTERIYRELALRARTVLATGHAVVVDAVFAASSERAAIADTARALGVPFSGLFLSADLATRVQRIGQRRNDASDATPQIARMQDAYDLGAIDWHAIDASGSPGDTLARSMRALGGARSGDQRCST